MIPGRAPHLWVPPACVHRPLMDEVTFNANFSENPRHQTYLCYEVKVLEDDSRGPVNEFKGFLSNQVTDHSRQGLPILGHSGRRFSVHKGCPLNIVPLVPVAAVALPRDREDEFCCDW